MVVLLVCGGGNGAHALAGIAASQSGIMVRVLTLYADEAERWSKSLQTEDYSVIYGQPHPKTVKAKPSLVTKDASVAVPGADMIVLTVPAFAHAQYLEACKKYVKPQTLLVGLPGQAGFEFQVRGIWGQLADECTIMSFESLPWACRIKEFGKSVEILGTKESLGAAVQLSKSHPGIDPIIQIQACVGPKPTFTSSGHLLGITLMALNGIAHPSILYGKWHDWDGKPCDEPPLFYNGMNQLAADLMSGMSDEALTLAKTIMQQRPQVDLTNVVHIFTWFMKCYKPDVADPSTLLTATRTSRAHNGLNHPMVKTEDDKFVPDYKHRYLTEDLPYGLVVMRGIAEVAGIATPNMDRVLVWAQQRLGHQYLVDGKLTGKDMCLSRAPQRYGFCTLDGMLGL